MKSLFKYQEMMTKQQKTYQIFYIIKTIISLSVKIYEDKEIQIFLNKMILNKIQKIEEGVGTTKFFIDEEQQKQFYIFFGFINFNRIMKTEKY